MRYRAIDSDRPPPPGPSQSPNPKFSFLSASPIPGESEVDVDEVIRRELEKEQTRLQNIIAEASRKRDLVADFLQDMTIDREMGIRQVSDTGMSLEEKLTLLINQMKRPNQNQIQVLNRADTIGAKHGTIQLPQLQQMHVDTGTSVLESNKEKLIVLARATPIGAKRKAWDTQSDIDKDLKGKKQKVAEEAVLEAKTMSVNTGEIVSSELSCLRKLSSGKQVESKLEQSFKFWCEICGVGTYSETVMRNHELGKKHKTVVEAFEKASTSLSPTSVTAPESEAITEGENKKMGTLWCKTCKVKMNSEKTMRYHKLGKKHKAMHAKLMKELMKIPGYTEDDIRSLERENKHFEAEDELELEDALVIPDGPVTRSKAKKINQTVGGLVNQMETSTSETNSIDHPIHIL